MSLFANSRYQWRETYFVLFQRTHRPKAADVKRALAELGSRIELHELAADAEGYLESLTVVSHADAAGMDITYVEGDEVREQLAELRRQWKRRPAEPRERAHLERALAADARFDVYHFEEVSDFAEDEEDGPLDPGTLLLVLSKLARLCHGEAFDPQSGEILR
jgi:hypothetical protein